MFFAVSFIFIHEFGWLGILIAVILESLVGGSFLMNWYREIKPQESFN